MNAREEFVKHVGNRTVKCAHITRGGEWYDNRSEYLLSVGYSATDKEKFLSSINWNYDSGYGGQEVFGTIWYNDGTWSSRGEYDGSEWWEYHSVPCIPEPLMPKS